MKYTAKTDIGQKRENNEDYFYANIYDENTALFVVADGLGGYSSGEVASKMAVDTIKENFELNLDVLRNSEDDKVKRFFKQLLKVTNDKVYSAQTSEPKYKGMGTTIVLVSKINGKLFYTSIGDSRLYYIDKNKQGIKQVTIDDTYVNELLKKHLILEEEAETHPQKHVLTKAIGVFSKVDTETHKLEEENGYLILCSDGLTNMLNDDNILHAVMTYSFEGLSEEFVREANLNGGMDNITVIVVEI